MEDQLIKYNSSRDEVLHCDPSMRGVIAILEGVYKIGDEALNNCKHITEVKFPESLAYIGQGAFDGCDSLKSILIPKNVKRIEKDIFTGIKSLKSVVCLPFTLPDIPDFPQYYKSSTIMKIIGGPIYSKVILHVPSGAIAYSNHNY